MTPAPRDTAFLLRPFKRLHGALMPDYNRRATAYWWSMVGLGAAVLMHTLATLLAMPPSQQVQIGLGVLVAACAGFFPVRIPRSKNSFAAGEIFIFLLLLLHGPAAAILASTFEALIGAWRTSRRWTSRIVSPAMAAIAMAMTAAVLHLGLAGLRARGLGGVGPELALTMASAVLYFCVTTLFVTAVPMLKQCQWPGLRELFGSFGWVGITYAGSASIAYLLFLTFRQTGVVVLMAAVPIIAMLLSTLHYYFRQQEADEQVRRARIEAMEREAALGARHLGELQVSERRFHSAFTHASIGMALVAYDGRVLQANAALGHLLGAADPQAIEQLPFTRFVGEESEAALNDQLMRLNAQQIASFTIEVRMRHHAGDEVWAAVHGSVFSEDESVAPSLILQVQDITARRQAQAGMRHIAFHDSLTGLPNRRRFHDDLERAIARSHASPAHPFGLMFLDFDRFKLINDSLGHAVGDQFLVQMAQRIQAHLRPTDLVARLGGDEFAILAEDAESARYTEALAARLLGVLGEPCHIGGTEITSSASIGITFSGPNYETPSEMLRDADIAMYKAKALGKARYALFDSALHTEVAHRLRLEGDLRRALANGQVTPAYQPLFDLASGRIEGFEALARWQHPEFGFISPASFIPIAEDTGLIVQLTDLMLASACRQLKAWQTMDASLATLSMHVNVSGLDITSPRLVARVTAALVEAHLEPQHLTLELTENILMDRLEAALPQLTELRRLGVGLSVDDFGTGYSSLRHLSRLPVSSLKIDRSFVDDLKRDADDGAVVRAIVLLGNSLGKDIIAEGIETPDQVERLQEIGCTAGQGFHLSRPLTPEMADELLAANVAASNAALNIARPFEGSQLMH
jgi:diguanylate cyclase (GGDEF)-like protein/PAS domain S-box-containing protein